MSDIGYLPSESRNSQKRTYRHAYGVPLPPLRRGKPIIAPQKTFPRKKKAGSGQLPAFSLKNR